MGGLTKMLEMLNDFICHVKDITQKKVMVMIENADNFLVSTLGSSMYEKWEQLLNRLFYIIFQ